MKRLAELVLTGLILSGLAAPLMAQKEEAPPAIPPLLEGNRPLVYSESQNPEKSPGEVDKPAPARVKPEKKAKTNPAVTAGKKKGKRAAAATGKKKSTKTAKKKSGVRSRSAAPSST